MKRIINILFLLLVATQGIHAQDSNKGKLVEASEFNLWNKHKGDKAVVYADIAYIRDFPSTKSNVIDSLTQGDEIKINSIPYNNSIIRGFEAPWYKIKYSKNGVSKDGYIWLGLVALGNQQQDDIKFIHGILRYEKETSYSPATYFLEIKALDKQNNTVAKQYYPIQIDGQSYTDNKILGNMGLEGLSSIHRIGFMSEACGVPTDHYYFGFNGSEFITMFKKTAIGDAGIFYHEEKILFPSEHNLAPNLIIKDIESGEVIDEEAEELKYKIKKSREKYIWDGKHVSQVIEMHDVKK